MPRLQVIVASTRPGRVGQPVSEWFVAHARAHGGFEVELTDLATYHLPLMDEPNHPRLKRYENQHTKHWSERVDASDAFVFVTPEYNHSFNAPLKNALDYLHNEWQYKPAGFVSYGGIAAGTRALQALKPVVGALKLFPVVEAVNIPFVAQFIDEEDVFKPNDILTQAADAMLNELLKLDGVLAPLRAS